MDALRNVARRIPGTLEWPFKDGKASENILDRSGWLTIDRKWCKEEPAKSITAKMKTEAPYRCFRSRGECGFNPIPRRQVLVAFDSGKTEHKAKECPNNERSHRWW